MNYFSELEENAKNGMAKRSTNIQRRKAVNNFIKYLNSKKASLNNVTSENIEGFLQYLSQKKTIKGKPMAPATIKQILALSKSFYIRCYQKKLVKEHVDVIFHRDLLKRYKIGEKKLPKYII